MSWFLSGVADKAKYLLRIVSDLFSRCSPPRGMLLPVKQRGDSQTAGLNNVSYSTFQPFHPQLKVNMAAQKDLFKKASQRPAN